MKKVVLTIALFSTFVISAKATTVYAEIADDTHGTSIAKVGLEKQDETDEPTDPIDPPDVPGTYIPTGNTGALRIDYISNIDFGTQKIASETKTIQLGIQMNLLRHKYLIYEEMVQVGTYKLAMIVKKQDFILKMVLR